MDLQTAAAVIGILSGMVTLIGGVANAINRLRDPTQGQRVPIPAGAYPHPPPMSNVAGPYAPGGNAPPPGYRWPNYPQPGGAQPGYSQPGATPPGYGAPAGQWGNIPQPAAPYSFPPQAPYGPRSLSRSRTPYLWIGVGLVGVLFLGGLIAALTHSLNSSANPGGSPGGGTTASDPAAIFLGLLASVIFIAILGFVIRQFLRARQHAPQPSNRRWFTYPLIAIIAAEALLSSGLIGLLNPNASSTSTTSLTPTVSAVIAVLTVIVLACYVLSVALAARQAIRLRRWGWLVTILLFLVYGPLAFGIFGPTTSPRRA